MKRILLTIIALGCLVVAKAQNDMAVATLQHGDAVSVFKGPSALASALAAANEAGGDVITLSQGTFTAATITKPVSIYGAGFETDNSKGTLLTTISGNLTVGRDDNTTVANVHLEGFYLNGQLNVGGGSSKGPLENLRVVKAFIKSTYVQSTNDNTSFDQCVIYGSCESTGVTDVVSDLYFSKCVFRRASFWYYKNASSSIVLDHCIVNAYHNTGATGGTFNKSHDQILELRNSIYIKADGSGTAYVWPSGSSIQGCISDREEISGFENCYQVAINNIFKDGENGTYSPTRTYELQQPTVWVNAEGKQIGIHGGSGWSKVPSTPVVKNLNVTPSGTNLNVTYEAEVR